MSTKIKSPKAYSYLRFSTPEQAKGDSHRRQSEAAQKYAAQHGLELVDATYHDLGVSAFRGANAETGMLREFLDAVQSGAVERGSWLLIESLDRLSRAVPRKAIRVLEEICDEGVTLVTLSDGKVYTSAVLNQDPVSFIMAFLVAMRANEESETKSKRMKAAWQQKRKLASEKKLTAKAPTWLELTSDRCAFEIIQERGRVVRRIYEMCASGIGYAKIAEVLNREGVPTFGGGSMWHRSFVTKLLQGSTAVGTYSPSLIEHEDGRKQRRAADQIPNYYPAVVSVELDAAVKLRLKAPSARGRHANSGAVQNILANLCKCSRCGGSVTLVSKGRRDAKRLICSRAKAGAGCDYTSIPYPEVEDMLVSERDVWLLLDFDDDHPMDSVIEELDTQIEQTKSRISEFLGLKSSTIRAEIARLDELLDQKENERRAIVSTIERTTPDAVHLKLEIVREALSAPTLERTKVNATLKQLLNSATIGFDDGYVHLDWRHGAKSSVRFRWVADPDQPWSQVQIVQPPPK